MEFKLELHWIRRKKIIIIDLFIRSQGISCSDKLLKFKILLRYQERFLRIKYWGPVIFFPSTCYEYLHLILILQEFCWILQKLSASTQHPLRESEAHHGHMSIVTTFCRLAACLYDRTRHCCQGACAGSLSQCRD